MMCYSLLKLMRFHKGERLTVTQRQEPATRVVLMTSTHNTQAESRRESSEDPASLPCEYQVSTPHASFEFQRIP